VAEIVFLCVSSCPVKPPEKVEDASLMPWTLGIVNKLANVVVVEVGVTPEIACAAHVETRPFHQVQL
jgi:hypothetical protein